MAHGTYNNPRAGTTSSKGRMENLTDKVNGNGEKPLVLMTKVKYKGGNFDKSHYKKTGEIKTKDNTTSYLGKTKNYGKKLPGKDAGFGSFGGKTHGKFVSEKRGKRMEKRGWHQENVPEVENTTYK